MQEALFTVKRLDEFVPPPHPLRPIRDILKDRVLYQDAEVVARSARLGLWSDDVPVPPWDFRKPPHSTVTH